MRERFLKSCVSCATNGSLDMDVSRMIKTCVSEELNELQLDLVRADAVMMLSHRLVLQRLPKGGTKQGELSISMVVLVAPEIPATLSVRVLCQAVREIRDAAVDALLEAEQCQWHDVD